MQTTAPPTVSAVPLVGVLIVQLPELLIVPRMFAASVPPVWKLIDLAAFVPTVNAPSDAYRYESSAPEMVHVASLKPDELMPTSTNNVVSEPVSAVAMKSDDEDPPLELL